MELLAAVAIVLLLAALVFPYFKGSLTKAASAKSMRQMQTIGFALQTYANDNDSTYPFVAGGSPLTPWCRTPLDPYLPMNKNSENAVFSCPNAKAPNGVKVRRAYSAGGAMYGISGASRAQNTAKSRNTLTINRPGKAPLFFDGVVRTSGLCRDGTDWSTIQQALKNTNADENNYIDYRHNGRAHFYFADHHIEALNPQQAAEAFPDSRTYEGM